MVGQHWHVPELQLTRVEAVPLHGLGPCLQIWQPAGSTAGTAPPQREGCQASPERLSRTTAAVCTGSFMAISLWAAGCDTAPSVSTPGSKCA